MAAGDLDQALQGRAGGVHLADLAQELHRRRPDGQHQEASRPRWDPEGVGYAAREGDQRARATGPGLGADGELHLP
ncbi:MAG TPA: hypothetical protein VHN78_13850, partial [Chloroflexota bacterium]|nr:hypothetical protein [Chloroflexota bacterium]